MYKSIENINDFELDWNMKEKVTFKLARHKWTSYFWMDRRRNVNEQMTSKKYRTRCAGTVTI